MRLHQAAGTLFDHILKADAINQVDRIEYIAFGFGHFLPMGITDQAVHIYLTERYITHKL